MYQAKHTNTDQTRESSSESRIKLELENLENSTLNSYLSEINVSKLFTNNLPISRSELEDPENINVTEKKSNVRNKNEIYLQDVRIKEEIYDHNIDAQINEFNAVEDNSKSDNQNEFNINLPSIKNENDIICDNKIYNSIEFTPNENNLIDNAHKECNENKRNDVESKETDTQTQTLFNDIYNCTLKTLLNTNRNMVMKKMLSFPTCDYTAKVGAFKIQSKPTVSQAARKQTPFDAEKPYACLQCDFRTKRKQHLDDHMRIHTGEKPFRCNSCDYKCSKKSSLIRHEKIHSGRTPYECKFCDFKSCVKQSIIRHNRQHVGEKVFACSYCNYKCLRLSFLVRHERVHTGEKPFACHVCDYRSNNKSNLITHARKHTGEKPYACAYCDYRSSDKSHLITHCRQHTGEKPYACDYCEYRSCNKANLVIHHRQHTGEKPFACDYCKYKSSTKANLVTHIRIHTGEKPYACQRCDYKCSNHANLITHSNQHKEGIKET